MSNPRSAKAVPESCHTAASTAAPVSARDNSLIVTGNPNVGKSVLFHVLTGRYATVSNYPGTTVMMSSGTAVINGSHVRVADTPGLNSLHAASEDEMVARDLLLDDQAAIIQVCDAKNLLRALTLTLELAEANARTVLVLNMMDEARERRMHLDVEGLQQRLGIPVAPMIATQRWGLDRLRGALPHASGCSARVTYPAAIEEALAKMEPIMPATLRARKALMLLWLAGDRSIADRIEPSVGADGLAALSQIAAEAQAIAPQPLSVVIAQARMQHAQQLVRQVMRVDAQRRAPWLERLGSLAMHPVWGLPVLAGVLALMYWLVGDLAAQHGVAFMEEIVFGRYLTPAMTWLAAHAVPWVWGRALLVGEYGLLTMALPYAFAIILPIVGMFFLCFGLLEDVGYLPRLAVMSNRFCALFGLNGKAVLPLVLGLGCDTMATMTCRILETRRDRLLVTLLLALGVPCSAQLAVILAMMAGQPPASLAIWIGVVLAVMVIIGRAAARLIPGETSPFLYEIPPLRRPKLSNVVVKTLGRMEWYIKEAVPLFFLGTLLLFLLDRLGALVWLRQLATPVVVSWLGLPAKATDALLVGFLRRDFGAAGLFALQRSGALTGIQTVVSLVTITLFVPCIAQYFMMVKEHGAKIATRIAAAVFLIAFVTGGVLMRALTALRVL
ncbi:MAG: ferrous iron transport protein B [Candidatus Omnitrophica bacterium]|nr:ferrous iron transport protein B [Candidatus Omnitrophota bacterium]